MFEKIEALIKSNSFGELEGLSIVSVTRVPDGFVVVYSKCAFGRVAVYMAFVTEDLKRIPNTALAQN